MKIGIITQPLHNNYGGLLQNYALQTVLKRMGHEPLTLDWKNKEVPLTFKNRLARFKGYIYSLSEKTVILKNCNFDSFKNDEICRTRPISVCDDFLSVTKENDLEAFVVGSDQCWRPMYSYPFLEQMFLSFTKDLKGIKRVAYAASFGTDKWEFTEDETLRCSSYVKEFDSVTVRESSGIELCKRYLDVNANLVLDPTLLLSECDYVSLIQGKDLSVSPGSLYYYVLDNNEKINQFINHVSKSTGYRPFCVSQVNKNIVNYPGEVLPPSVFSWVKGFQDAEMVVVDSFHGMVFSIIFNKPFWVIGNCSRGLSRFESLLKLLDLEDRLIDVQMGHRVDLQKKIDWHVVNAKLSFWKNKSVETLNDILSNE